MAAWGGLGPIYSCPSGGCPISLLQSAVPVIGVILVLDALVCFIGFRSAFIAGGALSAAIAGITLYGWPGQAGGVVWASLVVLSVLSVVLDVLAIRSRGQLKEQANPMNLPVFG